MLCSLDRYFTVACSYSRQPPIATDDLSSKWRLLVLTEVMMVVSSPSACRLHVAVCITGIGQISNHTGFIDSKVA